MFETNTQCAILENCLKKMKNSVLELRIFFFTKRNPYKYRVYKLIMKQEQDSRLKEAKKIQRVIDHQTMEIATIPQYHLQNKHELKN